MSYDAYVVFGAPQPREVVETLLHTLWTPHLAPNGPHAWRCEGEEFEGPVAFTAEATKRTRWRGRVEEVAFNLCYGGTPAEAALFARSIRTLAGLLKGVVVDPQLGGPVTADVEEQIVAKWAEANVWSLGNYASGEWLVRTARNRTQLPDGRVLFVEALRYPDAVLNHLSLAACWSRFGDHERANAACTSALEVAPDDAGATFLLGVGTLELGRRAEAAKLFRRALELDPAHRFARSLLERALGG